MNREVKVEMVGFVLGFMLASLMNWASFFDKGIAGGMFALFGIGFLIASALSGWSMHMYKKELQQVARTGLSENINGKWYRIVPEEEYYRKEQE